MDSETLSTWIAGCALVVSLYAIWSTHQKARLDHIHAVTRSAIEVTEVALTVYAEARELLRGQHMILKGFKPESKTNQMIAVHQEDASEAIEAMSKLLEDASEKQLAAVKLHELQQKLGIVLHGKYELQMIRSRLEDNAPK